jgi:YebC/PmpR family DNA-binding regulatory protein
MSGHSKWATTKHHKGVVDAKRSALFSKLTRIITVAAKTGGDPSPENNASLAAAIAKAKSYSLPREKIETAINKAFAAGADAATYDEVIYEGYGAAGVALYVEALTDNRNRTAADVRSAFSKYGGALGETNSVAFMFDRVGQIAYKPAAGTPDRVLEAAIEAGADDVRSDDDGHVVTSAFADFGEVAKNLEGRLGEAETVKAVWQPRTTASLDEEKAETMMQLVGALEDHDDVQAVYSNFEVSDEVLAKLTAA